MAMPSRESGGVSLLAGAPSLAPSRCKAPASGWGGSVQRSCPQRERKASRMKEEGIANTAGCCKRCELSLNDCPLRVKRGSGG